MRYRPHVALVDLFIGEESGAEVCERMRAAEPATRVLLFSGAGEISPARRPGGGRLGLRLQGLAGRGGSPAPCGSSAWAGPCSSATSRQGALGLSDRERAVLEHDGRRARPTPRSARRCTSSKHTVKEHSSAVYRKLGVRNRTEAVQRAQRLGLLG